MKKRSLFAMMAGFISAQIAQEFGYHFNDWQFWLIVIIMGGGLLYAYNKCKNDD